MLPRRRSRASLHCSPRPSSPTETLVTPPCSVSSSCGFRATNDRVVGLSRTSKWSMCSTLTSLMDDWLHHGIYLYPCASPVVMSGCWPQARPLGERVMGLELRLAVQIAATSPLERLSEPWRTLVLRLLSVRTNMNP